MVIDWLLGADQPAARYRTLTELEGRPASDTEVRAARAQIPHVGWAATLLADRNPGGWWVDEASLYRPKYVSTNWKMIVLADLGLSRQHPAIRASAERWMRAFPARGGAVGGLGGGAPHHCLAGNLARSLVRLGYTDDPRVAKTFDWLAESADPKGGWSCFGSGRNLDSWEGLSAFAVYPRARWTAPMQRAVDAGLEFFLERELHRQGARYAPWYRFHYPVHYYYDILVGLDTVTALGRGDDPRLKFALDLLRSKRRPDGRWNLDAVHPDVEGPIARWFRDHPTQRPVPFELEPAGRPSKMVTLAALRVLQRVET
jgi:hypothetical protein